MPLSGFVRPLQRAIRPQCVYDLGTMYENGQAA